MLVTDKPLVPEITFITEFEKFKNSETSISSFLILIVLPSGLTKTKLLSVASDTASSPKLEKLVLKLAL